MASVSSVNVAMADSPCVRNCCLDQYNCCLGCGRLLDEIIEWHSANVLRRQQILEQAAGRLQQRNLPDITKRHVVNPSE